jgi:hypothetical protein
VTVTRRHWQDLPAAVRKAVQQHTGQIRQVQPVATGAVSNLVVILDTATGLHFCKGVDAGNPLGWMHRNEARLNPHLPDLAPRLRWQVDHDGWLLLGFTHVPGRHPDLTPGSADLHKLADTLTTMTSTLTPGPPVPVQAATARWAGRLPPEIVDGDTLAHTDVTPRNFLMTGTGMAVVDWSMPCRGAAWIDTAIMVIRLIRAAHSPAHAETWAHQIPAWQSAPPKALDAFATANAALLHERHTQSNAPHLGSLAAAAEAWSQHRAVRPQATT